MHLSNPIMKPIDKLESFILKMLKKTLAADFTLLKIQIFTT